MDFIGGLMGSLVMGAARLAHPMLFWINFVMICLHAVGVPSVRAFLLAPGTTFTASSHPARSSFRPALTGFTVSRADTHCRVSLARSRR